MGSADDVRKWLRRKNFTIFLFLGLYALAKVALYVDDHAGTFMPREVLLVLSGLPAIFITLFFANLVVRVVSPFISRFFKDELEPEQRIFFAKIFEIFMYGLALAFILYSFGVTASSLLILLGFISGGLAFGLREPVLSFIVWLILLNKKPFRLGDTIRVGQHEGAVERIGTFYLTLNPSTRTADEAWTAYHPVKVPNRMLVEVPIENYGRASITQRARFQIQRRPRNVEKSLKEIRSDSVRALKKLDAKVTDVFLDVQNTLQTDKIYVVIEFQAGIHSKLAARSALAAALLKKRLFL